MTSDRRRPLPSARPRPAGRAVAAAGSARATGRRPVVFTVQRWRAVVIALPGSTWIGALAVASVVGFLPWIVYLGFSLPAKVQAQHYDISWLGFDCAMCTVLAALALCALRRHAATGPLAAIASMMLVVDGWFDIFTSSAEHGAMGFAIVLALCGELPLAILCGWAAVHTERVRSRALRSMHDRWEQAVSGAETAAAGAIARVGVSERVAPRPR